MKALRMMEKALSLRGQAGTTPATAAAVERLVVKYNTVAVRCFKQDDFETGAALLNCALQLTEPHQDPLFGGGQSARPRLRGTTFNNFGCLERRRGRLELAVNYMRQSLDHDGEQSPVTFLNMGAILTQLGHSADAVQCSRRAVELLSASDNENMGLLAIAHHNLAMALEPVDADACYDAYQRALETSRAQLGNASPTTQSIERNMDRFTKESGHALKRNAAARSAPAPTQAQMFLPPIARSERQASLQNARSARRAGATHKAAVKPQRSDDDGASATTAPRASTADGPTSHKRSTDSGKPKTPATTTTRPRPPAPPRTASTVAPKRKSVVAYERHTSRHTSSMGHRSGSSSDDDGDTPRPPKPPTQRVNEPTAVPTRQRGARPPEPEDERRKDDIVSFMVSRLGALLRGEEEFEMRYAAAVKIQCLARASSGRANFQKRLLARQQAVMWREAQETNSAKVIVDFFAMLVARRKSALEARLQAAQLEQLRDRVAVKIQSAARRWLAKQKVKRLRIYYKSYSTSLRMLQCWFRRMLACREVSRMRAAHVETTSDKLEMERWRYAAQQVQRLYRAHLASVATYSRKTTLRAQRERDRDSNRTTAAKKLQSLWRGCIGRSTSGEIQRAKNSVHYKREFAERRLHATLLLQAFARGCGGRRTSAVQVAAIRLRRQVLHEGHRLAAVVRIQSFSRRIAAVARVRTVRLGFRAARQDVLRHQQVLQLGAFARAAQSALAVNAVCGRMLADFADAKRRVEEQLAQTRHEAAERQAAAQREIDESEAEQVQKLRALEAEDDKRRAAAEETRRATEEATAAAVEAAAALEVAAVEAASMASQTSAAAIPSTDSPLRADAVAATECDSAAAAVPVYADMPGSEASIDEVPYVVPPRVETPLKLKISMEHLERQRKAELEQRKQKRLDDFVRDDASRLRTIPVASPNVTQAQRHTAALQIQSFLRGAIDRQLFAGKRCIVQEYIDDLVALHERAPQRPAAPRATGAPRRQSFAVLEEMTARIPTQVAQERQGRAVLRTQACLRWLTSCSHTDEHRRAATALAPLRAAAASVLSVFCRMITARRELRRRQAAATVAVAAAEVASEHHRRSAAQAVLQGFFLTMVARRSVAALFVQLQVAAAHRDIAEKYQAAHSPAQQVLARFSRTVAAKKIVRARRALVAANEVNRIVERAAATLHNFWLIISAKHDVALLRSKLALSEHCRINNEVGDDSPIAPSPAELAAALAIQGFARVLVSKVMVAAKLDAVHVRLDALNAENRAAVTIQCAERRRHARAVAGTRRQDREDRWTQQRQEAELEANSSQDSTPAKSPKTEAVVDDRSAPNAADVIQTDDVHQQSLTDENAAAALSAEREHAAVVLQCAHRSGQARQQVTARREATKERLASLRATAEVEEAGDFPSLS
jgi:hypothetical protein